jgi:hypothetical protein
MDGADIGVVQNAGRLRLAQKPPVREGSRSRDRHASRRSRSRRRAPAAEGLRQVAVGDQLDRHLAPQPRVLRPVNVAHAPGADLFQDPVWSELCAL